MQRKGGMRRKSRSKMRNSVKERGKLYISKFLQEFDNGCKVVLKANPTYTHGLYFLRFHGRIGEIIGKQGDCYKVQLKDGGKVKQFITHPVHLKRV
jgi:large subunit ribosomal protein L21e